MCSDFNGTCAGIGIRAYCNAFRQILFGMIIIMNMHAKAEIINFNFLTKRKHGFLCTTADEDFCILSDSNIRPIINRADIIGNRLSIFIYDILICCLAHARYAAPGQGSGGDGHGDDAGQGWGAVVDRRLTALVVPLSEFGHDDVALSCLAVDDFVDSIHSVFPSTLIYH